MKFKLITTLLACTALATTAHAAQPKKKLNADDRAKIAAMKKIVDSGLLFEDGIAKFATPDFAKAINGNIPGPQHGETAWTCSFSGSYSGVGYTASELKKIFKSAKYTVLKNGAVKVHLAGGIVSDNEYVFIKDKANAYRLDDVMIVADKRYSRKKALKEDMARGCADL